jgi:hypothetical protein
MVVQILTLAHTASCTLSHWIRLLEEALAQHSLGMAGHSLEDEILAVVSVR